LISETCTPPVSEIPLTIARNTELAQDTTNLEYGRPANGNPSTTASGIALMAV